MSMEMEMEQWKLMGKMGKIRRRDLGEFIWRLWLKGLGRIWRRSEKYVPFPFPSSPVSTFTIYAFLSPSIL